jgi:hypothetical protein
MEYVIGKDKQGNDIKVQAILKDSGIWIDNGTVLVEPTPEWIASNQPVIEPLPAEKTQLEIIQETLDTILLTMLEV